jgi:hypothetical protein
MRRATITISDELESSLDAYIKRQEAAPPLTAVVNNALREYLAHRGFHTVKRRLRVTPAKKGSGVRDVSVHHDRFLAER